MGTRIGVAFCAFLLGLSTLAYAESCPETSCLEYLVKFTNRTSESQINAILQRESLRIVHYFDTGHIYHLDGDHVRPQEEILKELNADPDVVYAEPNYSIQADLVPNDPRFPDLWAFQNTGQYDGTLGIDIGMESVWDGLSSGGAVIVAVLDSGIDYTHEDLADNVWINSHEIPDNHIDDDGNGYVDDVYGYDFAEDTGDPFDDYFHGTHVAGIIGAVGNNGVGVTGIAGLNGHVKLMALKFMGADGRGSLSDAIRGIDYAVRNGAKVINNSWDFTYPGLMGLPSSPAQEPVQSLRDAIVAADRAGVIFVAAAGNAGTNSDVSPTYPSSYSVGNIISVSATDNHDSLPAFSNYGATTVDLGAPGVMIESTFPTWKESPPYHFLSGTSMACPQVTGSAALLWSENPNLTHRQVIDFLLQGVDHVPSLNGKSVTGGRLDLAQSFSLGSTDINHPPVAYAGALQSRIIQDTVLLQGTATDADGDSPLTFQWKLASPTGVIVSFTGARISFIADLVGTYVATLIVGDGESLSVPSTVKIYVTAPVLVNHAPVASAGPNQLRHVGDEVILHGSGTDLDGDSLTYRWTLTLPTGSHTALVSSTSATASFVVDVTGTYVVSLVVNDGKVSSLPATAKIYIAIPTVANHVPVASAGPNQLRRIGDTVILHGSGTDLDGDSLTYRWSLMLPTGSHTALVSSTSATASFYADVMGTYNVSLVVNDGKVSSLPATAKIYIMAASATSVEGQKTDVLPDTESPEMNVTIDAQQEGAVTDLDPELGGKVEMGKAVLLDGTGSGIIFSTGEIPLDYEWVLIEKPVGSESAIQEANQANASLVPDVEGRYTVQLEVSAGKYSSRSELALLARPESLSVEDAPDQNQTGAASGGCSLLIR